LNRLQQQYLKNPFEQNRFTRLITPSASPNILPHSPRSYASTYSYYNSEETECWSQSISQTQQHSFEQQLDGDTSTSIILSSFQGLQSNTTMNDIIATAINNVNIDF